VQQCLVEAAQRLTTAGLPDARHESYALLQHATGWTLTELLSRLQEPAPAGVPTSVVALVKRRLRREPLQHILGSTEFYGRKFHVGRETLIPRPETEILIERTLSALCDHNRQPLRILDVGTGSGVVAITLALELRDIIVDAVDISATALKSARANVIAHGAEQINLLRGDLGTALTRVYNAVVANLPYVCHGDMARLQPEVRAWEPAIALDGGADGLTQIRRLVAQAPSLLVPGGLLALEIGAGQSGEVNRMLQATTWWDDIRVDADLAGIPRVVLARLTGHD